jgi:hypothetical protein
MKIRLLHLAIWILLLPVMAFAEGTNCRADDTIIVPDGRITESIISPNTTFHIGFYADAGHSYSVEVRAPRVNGYFPLVTTVYDSGGGANGNCTGASNLPQNDTTLYPPRLVYQPCQGCGNGATRVSFTEPAGDGVHLHDVTIVNTGAAGTNYTFSVSDTTLFSPSFSTYAGFAAYYSVANTTDFTINVTLTLLDGAGNAIVTTAAAIGPAGSYSTNTTSRGVPASTMGSARLTHDGPPGAVVATAANINFSGNGCCQVLPFIAVRDKR